MLADHTAYFLKGSFDDNTYLGLRIIGRLAFPLFAFLLVESFHFTKNRLKHFIKIVVLALISEIPYNLFITGKLKDFRYQNAGTVNPPLRFVTCRISKTRYAVFYPVHLSVFALLMIYE